MGGVPRERVFIALYERHYAAVLAYARRRVAHESDARDVAAETFLVAWRRLDEAEHRGLPWLFRTAQLTVANLERSHRRSQRTISRLQSWVAAEPVPDHAEGHAERQRLASALLALSEADRELLLLVLWEQLAVREAAEVLAVAPGTAAVRLHRAKRRLRAALVEADRPQQPQPARSPLRR
jgi:RNA polymerase sigma-70 factor, ECF subfamily